MTDLQAAAHALADLTTLLAMKASPDAFEARLKAILQKRLNGQYDAVMAALGDPPDVTRLDETFWQGLDAELRDALTRELRAIYLESASSMLLEVPFGVDWTLVNSGAAEWAKRYSYELVKGITATTRDAIAKQVSGFYGPGATLGDVKDALAPLFGEVRAQMIAVTETTRAAVQGRRGTVAEIAKAGIRMRPIWLTNRDETTCPRCRPLDKTSPGPDGLYRHPNTGETFRAPPDPHPGCRCGERWVIAPPN